MVPFTFQWYSEYRSLSTRVSDAMLILILVTYLCFTKVLLPDFVVHELEI